MTKISKMIFYMRSGQVYDFADDHMPPIQLADLLQSVALERRFYNQVDWNVLQHSVAGGIVAERMGLNTHLKQHLYTHDLHEAFCRDKPSFLKTEDEKVTEEIIKAKVQKSLGVDPLSIDDEVIFKQIDGHLAVVESHEFFGHAMTFDACVEQEFCGKKPKTQMDIALIINCTNAIRDTLGLQLSDQTGRITDVALNIFRGALSAH